MPTYTNWYVVVVMEVAGKQREVKGPKSSDQTKAEADLNALRGKLGTGEWIDLDWISANPKHVVAAYVDSRSFGAY
jgi:hypothetical protein